ncbi:MAG TPA: SEL1-like repeat protein [Chitinophagaceae bacterium]|jgi:hypothetical protein|nr:SEL1-like repeat protein [Chitinophagaceae bacterium]
MRQVIKLFLLIVLVNCFSKTYSQKIYNYTAADKLAIVNANKKTALMKDRQLGGQQAYALGLEYQRIYNKYRDTSMASAVKCFEYYCFGENEYMFTVKQKQMAYRLGEIYEKGTGIARDTMMAIVWYQLSTAAGVTKAQGLQKKFCDGPLSLYAGDEKMNPLQAKYKLLNRATLGLPALPSCRYNKEQIAAVVAPIAEAMKEAPHLVLWVDHSVNPYWNSTHSYNVKQELKRVMDAVAVYLIDKVGISYERVKIAPADIIREHGHRGASWMEFHLISFEELSEKESETPEQ